MRLAAKVIRKIPTPINTPRKVSEVKNCDKDSIRVSVLLEGEQAIPVAGNSEKGERLLYQVAPGIE